MLNICLTHDCLNYYIDWQAYSYGGTVGQDNARNVEEMKKIKHREITIKFNADISSSMRWNFKPQQYELKVRLMLKVVFIYV